jgi:hypothetical protein
MSSIGDIMRVLSPRAAHAGVDGEDWSAEHSSDPLVAHVRERGDCSLGCGRWSGCARKRRS